MNSLRNKNGITLIELVAVLVILGIIAAIGFFTIGDTIFNARVRSYEVTVSSLNEATEFYALNENIYTEDIFDGYDSNSERISVLFNTGYLTLLPQPVAPYSYIWDVDAQEWQLESEEIIVIPEENVGYDFESERLVQVIEEGGVIASGSFTDTGTSIDSTYGLLFIDNNNETYTVAVTAALTEGTNGGYGVFFETKLNDALKDSGYIIQFDRGYNNGEIIVRKRTDSKEGNPLYRYSVRFDDDGDGDFNPTSGTKNNQNPWWTETHEFKLVVELNEDITLNKIVSLYIDNIFIFEYAFQSGILAGEENLNQTGIRVWRDNTKFYSIEIS
ncbi:MAG: type II secretion system protein [Tenericutes bacterium]|nr:type II secretion system protein [Mycoplasmatota bacterium]